MIDESVGSLLRAKIQSGLEEQQSAAKSKLERITGMLEFLNRPGPLTFQIEMVRLDSRQNHYMRETGELGSLMRKAKAEFLDLHGDNDEEIKYFVSIILEDSPLLFMVNKTAVLEEYWRPFV